jgi:hypothetical protein
MLSVSDNMGKMAEGSKIGKFYADKSVFMTGATGFMGKVRI